MNEQNQTDYSNRDDEISLVDLLAVLIRFRRLIVGGTILVGFLAVLALYVVRPALQPASQSTAGPAVGAYTAQLSILVARIPNDLALYVTFDPASALRALLSDPQTVGAAYRTIAPAAIAQLPADQYAAHVRSTVIGAQLTHAYDQNTRVLTITVTTADPAATATFARALVAQLAQALNAQTVAATRSAETALATAYDSGRTALARAVERALSPAAGRALTAAQVLAALDLGVESSLAGLMETANMLERVRSFMNDPAAAFNLLQEPAVFEVPAAAAPTRRSTTVIIAVVTAFFLFVFLAFVLQYARNVRADKAEMEKLRAAWQGK